MSTFIHGGNVQANGIRQHYLRYGGQGSTGKPVLLLIPGITSPAITWGFVAERLGQHFDTYVLDARGRGLSSHGPDLEYGTGARPDDLGAFAKAMGIRAYHLGGPSNAARLVAWLEPVGTMWVNAIRMTVIPLVVSSLTVLAAMAWLDEDSLPAGEF